MEYKVTTFQNKSNIMSLISHRKKYIEESQISASFQLEIQYNSYST